MGFAPLTQEILLNPDNPIGKLDGELILASRQQEQAAQVSAAARNRGFQNLGVDSSLAELTGSGAENGGNGGGGVSASDLSSLPLNGAGADFSTESVAVAGTQGRTQDFGMGNEDELQQRQQDFRERAQREGGGFGGFGGPGGGGGFGGIGPGGGPITFGRIGRGFNTNQPHGFLYFQDDNSGLDAQPYSLSGQEAAKASYNTVKFGAFVGGPLRIPGIVDWSKSTFYTLGWNGTRGSTPYDQFSTVPTLAERSGNFSGLTDKNGNPIVIYDPNYGSAIPKQYH